MDAIIRFATSSADVDAVRTLLHEYAAWVGIDLSFQEFERELRELPGDYAPPSGALILASAGGVAAGGVAGGGQGEPRAGCVAVHRWAGSTCEMKRLFVRDAYRGLGIGRLLADAAVAWARDAGYERIRLDTLPSMEPAQRLYAALGFREIAPYRPNPVPGARFLELELGPDTRRPDPHVD